MKRFRARVAARAAARQSASGGGVAFSPLSISGCALWLDAADASTITYSSGSNLSQWRDKSDLANHFSLTSGTPASITDGGYRVVSIPSGAIMTSANQITFTTSSAFFIVSRYSSPSADYIAMLLGFTNINGANKGIRFYQNFLTGTTAGGYNFGDANELAVNAYYVNGTLNPGFESNVYVNVYSIISTVAPYSGGTSYVTLSSSTYSRFFIGNIAEFLYYPAGITNTQRQQVEGYLAWKWGLQASLPVGHPYKSAAPT